MGRKDSVRKFWQKISRLSRKNLDLKILLSLIVFLTLTNSALFYFYSQKRSKPRDFSERERQASESRKFYVAPTFSNLNSLFSIDHSWTATLSAEKKITLIATGDVIPARSVNFQMSQRNDFSWPFAKTYQYLKSADITLINLEAPLIKNCPLTNIGMIFCGNQKFIEGLKLADIDVVNLANNHSGNWGIEGLCQTIGLLENNQIVTSGFSEDIGCHDLSFWNPTESRVIESSVSASLDPIASLQDDKKQANRSPKQLAIKRSKGVTFGFLGFNFLTSVNQNELLQSIKGAKQNVDILVVSAHWGTEYTHKPTSFQKGLAHRMIDEGVDIVIGNHPHWIQPIEIYKGKPIIYAHGNFIFDQEWSEKTKLGVVAKFTLFDKRIVDIQLKPLKIKDYGQPYWLEGKEKEEVLKLLEEISRS